MLVKIVAALSIFHTAGVGATWVPWGEDADEDAVSMTEFQSFWVDSYDIIDNLSSYDKLWIKPHSCVWSECAVDDTDDGYTGDNRDGDEQWYQYRTQGFCANAAYSLYGRKKSESLFPSFSGCTRGHYINSFFTYGGADNLLKAVGKTPVVYSNDGYGNNNDDNDDSYGTSANAACVEIDYQGDDNSMSYNDDANNDGNNNRDLSGSNDYDGYSGTLGCTADGKYAFAAFQSNSCDGNYYAGIVDNFRKYNSQHNSVGCSKVYDGKNTENILMLLKSSWSCDIRLYPNGCPDPYGKKKQFDFAIRTISHGGNPRRAYKNMVLKRPLHVTSLVLLVITILISVLTYIIKNKSRAIQSKGGNNLQGYMLCLKEDCHLAWYNLLLWIKSKGPSKDDKPKKKKKKKKKKKSRSKSRSKKNKDDDGNEDNFDDEIYVRVEDRV